MGVHPTTSRYLVVPCLAWALVLWLIIEQARTPSARWWRAATITVALLVFATMSNIRHADRGAEFARRFDQGAAAYHRDGSVAGAPRPLYPDPAQADAWLRAAEARGLYRMPAPQPPGDNPD
jgi:hypothetical protein